MALRRHGPTAALAALLTLLGACTSPSTHHARGPGSPQTIPSSSRTTGTTGTTGPTGTTAAAPGHPCGAMTPPPPRYDHVIWIWMENHRRDQVVGSPDAPFATSLAGACGSATDYRTVGRPSLPNYLAATSGGTHGVQDDAPPSDHPIDADNLFRQVRRSGGSA